MQLLNVKEFYRVAYALLFILHNNFLGAEIHAQQVNASLFPRPAELEPAIEFWVRVYTEVDTSSGF